MDKDNDIRGGLVAIAFDINLLPITEGGQLGKVLWRGGQLLEDWWWPFAGGANLVGQRSETARTNLYDVPGL